MSQAEQAMNDADRFQYTFSESHFHHLITVSVPEQEIPYSGPRDISCEVGSAVEVVSSAEKLNNNDHNNSKASSDPKTNPNLSSFRSKEKFLSSKQNTTNSRDFSKKIENSTATLDGLEAFPKTVKPFIPAYLEDEVLHATSMLKEIIKQEKRTEIVNNFLFDEESSEDEDDKPTKNEGGVEKPKEEAKNMETEEYKPNQALQKRIKEKLEEKSLMDKRKDDKEFEWKQQQQFEKSFFKIFFNSFEERQRLMRMEQQLNISYSDTLKKRENELNALRSKHEKEMSAIIENNDSELDAFVLLFFFVFIEIFDLFLFSNTDSHEKFRSLQIHKRKQSLNWFMPICMKLKN